MIAFYDFEQGSAEWFKCRLGIPTASMFSAVIVKGEGKVRRKYMYQLAAERITGQIADSYSNPHMERGKVMEEEARTAYAFLEGVMPEPVGFIRNGQMGASPDSLVENGLLEIKTKLPHLQIEALINKRVPPEHKAQVQGQMMVADREWCDFVSYWPGLPLLVVRALRDDEYIAMLSAEVGRFNDELDELEQKIRGMS